MPAAMASARRRVARGGVIENEDVHGRGGALRDRLGKSTRSGAERNRIIETDVAQPPSRSATCSCPPHCRPRHVSLAETAREVRCSRTARPRGAPATVASSLSSRRCCQSSAVCGRPGDLQRVSAVRDFREALQSLFPGRCRRRSPRRFSGMWRIREQARGSRVWSGLAGLCRHPDDHDGRSCAE